MGKLLHAGMSDGAFPSGDPVISDDDEEAVGKAANKSSASKTNMNAAAARVAAKKKRMAQTSVSAAKAASSGLLDLNTLKTLFSASLDAASMNQSEQSIVYKKAKRAVAAKQKRALHEVLKDDSDLSRIVKEAEHIKELAAREKEDSTRPSSEPGRKKKRLNHEPSASSRKNKLRLPRRRRKKKQHDFSRFQQDLRIVQPANETEATLSYRKRNAAPKVNISNVVKKAKMSMKEFQLIEMRFSDVQKMSAGVPDSLLSALLQFSDQDDENTASVVSRDEAKAALEMCEIFIAPKDVEAILDYASENVLDVNSVNYKRFCARAVKKYRKDFVCVQLGSARARKAAAAQQSNPLPMLSVVDEDEEGVVEDDGSAASPHAAFLQNGVEGVARAAPNQLPPLKIQQALAAKHLRKDGNFDDNFGRQTPHILQSNTHATVHELRRELELAERGLEHLQSEVKKGVQWVQLNCPAAVKSNRAKKYCKQWGVEKLKRFLMGQDSSNLVQGFNKWMDFVQFNRNMDNIDKFIEIKTCHKIFTLLSTFCLRQQGTAFGHWSNVCTMQRNREFQMSSVEIQRLTRGFLGRRFAHEVLRDSSACKIQNRWKCKKAKGITEGLRIQKQRNDAATLLQRKYRGYEDRKAAIWVVQGKREQRGALKIQSRWRGRGDRDRVNKLREEKEMNDGASLLQRRFRGFEARKEVARKKREKEMSEAASVIQRRYRGVQGQLIYAHKKLERDSSNTIQGAWRCYKAKQTTAGKLQEYLKKKRAEEEDRAARIMQGRARQYDARKRVNKLRRDKEDAEQDHAARILQNRARGFGARKRVAKMKADKLEKEEMDYAATKLQGRFRMRDAKKTVSNKRENKKRMEEEQRRRWQAQHDEQLRLELEEQDKAARVMQGKARQFGARKQLNKKRKQRDQAKAAKVIQKSYRTHRFLMKFNRKAHERKLRWMKEAEEKARIEAEKAAERERIRKEMELKEMNMAATKIQNVFRGRRARRKVEARRNELAVLEAEAERKRILAEQNAAAQRISNFMRVIVAKIKVKRRKEEHRKRLADLESAGDVGAAEIEKMKREMQAEIQAMELSASMQAEQDKKDLEKADAEHKEALEVEQALEAEQDEVERERAALKIQGVYKRRKARIEARKIRKEKLALKQKLKEEKEKEREREEQERRLAEAIDRRVKEEVDRRMREKEEEEERKRALKLGKAQNVAAVKIQGCYRSKVARKKVKAKKDAMLKEAEMIKKKAETMRLRISREKGSLRRMPPGEEKDRKIKEIEELEKMVEDLDKQAAVTRQDAIKHGMAGDMAVSAERSKFEREQAERIKFMEEEYAMHQAATKIENVYRGRKARKVMDARKEIALMQEKSEGLRYTPPSLGPPLGTFIRPGSIHRLEKYSGTMNHFGDDMEAAMEAQAAEFVKRENAKAAKEFAERRKIEKEKAVQDFAIAKREFDLVFGEEFDIADKKTVEKGIEEARRNAEKAAEDAAKQAAEEAQKKISAMEAKFETRLAQLEQWEKRLEMRERGAESQRLMALHAQGNAEVAQKELMMKREMEDIERRRRELEEKEKMLGSNSSAIVKSNPEEVKKFNEARALTPSKVVEWKKLWDEEAKSFYYLNASTNQAQWERPEGRGVSIVENGNAPKAAVGGEVTDYDTDNAETAGFSGGGGSDPTWQEFQDEGSGKSYWYNPETGESVWENPNKRKGGGGRLSDADAAEAKKWVSHIDPSTGVAYWYCAETGETKWEE